MAAIDVGGEAINRAYSYIEGRTLVAKDNPANATGKITTVEIWAFEQLLNCEVAIFFVVSGDNLSTRSTVAIGTVAAGSKQTFPVDLDVEAGDYIGIYYTDGKIEIDDSVAGMWEKEGDYIPCINEAFGAVAYVPSLYGIGAEVGWTGKISGVTNPAKIMGVGVANIAKVKGIA